MPNELAIFQNPIETVKHDSARVRLDGNNPIFERTHGVVTREEVSGRDMPTDDLNGEVTRTDARATSLDDSESCHDRERQRSLSDRSARHQ